MWNKTPSIGLQMRNYNSHIRKKKQKKKQVFTYQALCKFSRRQTDDSFIIFPRKYGQTLHANCLLRSQFACIVKLSNLFFFFFFFFFFLGKIRNIFQSVFCRNTHPTCKVLTYSIKYDILQGYKWNYLFKSQHSRTYKITPATRKGID